MGSKLNSANTGDSETLVDVDITLNIWIRHVSQVSHEPFLDRLIVWLISKEFASKTSGKHFLEIALFPLILFLFQVMPFIADALIEILNAPHLCRITHPTGNWGAEVEHGNCPIYKLARHVNLHKYVDLFTKKHCVPNSCELVDPKGKRGEGVDLQNFFDVGLIGSLADEQKRPESRKEMVELEASSQRVERLHMFNRSSDSTTA